MSRDKVKGFTLIELMVSLGLAVLMITCIAASTRGFFVLQELVENNRNVVLLLSENSLFAFDDAYCSEPDVSWETTEGENGSIDVVRSGCSEGEGSLFSDLFGAIVKNSEGSSITSFRLQTDDSQAETLLIFNSLENDE